jgi:hypothetical protein
MRRLGVVLVVLLMAVPAALTAAPNIPAGFSIESQRPLHSGVEYLTFSRGGDSPALAHVAHMSPGALVDLRTVSAHDRITHATEDRELPSSMCARVNCMVAINGDFWDYQVTKQSWAAWSRAGGCCARPTTVTPRSPSPATGA